MRLKTPFLKLGRTFDAERLAAEVRALPGSAWLPHPGSYPGNDAVPLVTPQGQITNAFLGTMAATPHLKACPAIVAIMEEIGAVWGRSRLMGLAPGASVPPHVDANYHWRTHMRIHIPVITNPKVIFTCDGEALHMAPGECWAFDSFRPHNVFNGGSDKRIHLVLDTVGGEAMWDLIEAAQGDGGPALPATAGEPRGGLRFETVELQRIMSPWEVRCHIDYIAAHFAPDPRIDAVLSRLDRFAWAWASTWAEQGDAPAAAPAYRRLIATLQQDLLASGAANLALTNHIPLIRALTEMVFQVAVPAPAQPAAAPGQRLAS